MRETLHLPPIRNFWRTLAALFALALFAGAQADAQKAGQSSQPQRKATSTNTPQTAGRRTKLTPLSTRDTPEGSRATITSDGELNGYSAFRSGDRFYVQIPQADASAVKGGLSGRGFTDTQVQQRGSDVVLTFRLQPGASARVDQRFNRLDVIVSAPGAPKTETAPTPKPANVNVAPSPTPSTVNRNQGRTSSEEPTVIRPAPTPTVQESSEGGRVNETARRNQPLNVPTPNTALPPDNATLPPVSTVLPSPASSPAVVPSATPPAAEPEQIAQAQPTLAPPAGTTTTAPVAPSTSIGATIASNWPIALIAALLLVGVGLFIASRATERRRPAAPVVVTGKAPDAIKETKVAETPVAKLQPAAPAPPPVVPPVPVISKEQTRKPPVEDVTSLVEKAEAQEVKSPVAVDTERIEAEISKVLEGKSYDENIIGEPDPEIRQIIAAELLTALAGRNLTKRENARAAFIKHGYFDDAAYDLQNAEAPAERASAARALGLLKERSATPYLIAALKDPAAEVRRAAVGSLAEIGDPAAVEPLKALREGEKERNVPRSLIQRAIEASSVREETETPTLVTAHETVVPASTQAEPIAAIETTPESVSAAETEPQEVAAVTPVVGEDITKEIAPPVVVEEIQDTETAQFEPTIEASAPLEQELEPEAYQANLVDTPPASVAVSEAETEYEDVVRDWYDIDITEQPATAHKAPVEEPPTPVVEEFAPGSLLAVAEPIEVEPPVEASAAEAVETAPVEDVAPVGEATLVEEYITTEELASTETTEPAKGIIPVDEPASRRVSKAKRPSTKQDRARAEKEAATTGEGLSTIPATVQKRLTSKNASERAASLMELSRLSTDDAFNKICAAFDDPEPEVRNAAARSLYNIKADRADSFTRALRDAEPERRRHIGAAIAASGLANEAISQLTGESREKTYDAFSLLFLMAKAGEVHPLIHAIESHPNTEVRLAVVKLLTLSGQHDILPAFRRLAVRGSLPTEVRSAVMEAIYQISSQPASNVSHSV